MVKIEQEFVSDFFKLKDENLDIFLDKMFEPLLPSLKHIISSENRNDPFMCLKLSVQTLHFFKKIRKRFEFYYESFTRMPERN